MALARGANSCVSLLLESGSDCNLQVILQASLGFMSYLLSLLSFTAKTIISHLGAIEYSKHGEAKLNHILRLEFCHLKESFCLVFPFWLETFEEAKLFYLNFVNLNVHLVSHNDDQLL